MQTLWEVATQLGLMLERAEAREQRERAAAELRTRDAILEAITRSAQTLLAEAELARRGARGAARARRGHRREPGVHLRERRRRAAADR